MPYVRIANLVVITTPDREYSITPPNVQDLAATGLDLLVQELGTEGVRLFLRQRFAEYRPDYQGVTRATGERWRLILPAPIGTLTITRPASLQCKEDIAMCGRYVSPSDRAIEQFWHIGARNSGRWIQSFNVAPTTIVPIVRLDEEGEPEVVAARWGLIPSWWKNAKPPSMSFIARSEEAASKPMWRQRIRTHRCLMPAQGWYEWNEHQQAKSPSGRKVNQPYYIHGTSEGVLAIAGMWASWQGSDGQDLVSCALLTKEAAPSIHTIHHRMPVILAPEQFDLWLSPRTGSIDVQEAISRCQQDFVSHPVSTQVNNTHNDYPELLEAVEVETQD